MRVRTLRLAQPPGIRSTGGLHSSCDFDATGDPERPDFLKDLDQFCARYDIPDEMARTIRSDLFTMAHRALNGMLRYDCDSEPSQTGTVCQIASQQGILEARLKAAASGTTQLHVRLLFSEPETVEGLILFLGTLFKEDYPIGRQQQDEHAAVCQWRGDDWLTKQDKIC